MTFRNFSLLSLLFLFLLEGCSTGPRTRTLAPKTATSKPYRITNSHMRNKLFRPKQHYEHFEEGYASYYGGRDVFHGRKTSTGEVFDKNKLMAAHRTLPLPSVVRVTNIDRRSKGYGRSIKVKVVDRGPFAHINKRIIDVSEKSAKLLGFYKSGTAKVRLETLVQDSIRLAQGRGYRHDNRIMLAMKSKPVKKLRVASLSPSHLKFLTTAIPQPKASPFAHQTAAQSVAPPQDIILAHSNSGTNQIIKPGQKPASIKDLFERSSPRTSSHLDKIAPRPSQKPSIRPRSLEKAARPMPPKEIFMTSGTDTGIFVQAGSYSQLKNAHSLKTTLQGALKTNNVKVSPLKVKQDTLYQVRLGPFDSSEQAEYLLAQLEQHGHDDACIIYE